MGIDVGVGQKNGNGSGFLGGVGINALSWLCLKCGPSLTSSPDDGTILGHSFGSNNQGNSNGANSGNKAVVVDGKEAGQSGSTGGKKTTVQDNSQKVRTALMPTYGRLTRAIERKWYWPGRNWR
jgi:hypothetical protein